MATSYSLDLRQRVWAAWQRGEGSQRELARRFAVSLSFVRDLSRRFRASGSVAAKPRGGGRPLLADAAALERVQVLVAARNDATNDLASEMRTRGCATSRKHNRYGNDTKQVWQKI